MRPRVVLWTWVLLALTTGSALAQESLTLDLDRNFGFAWADQIQGNFTLRAEGPSNLVRVVFLIDGQPLGEATRPPFEVRFHTGNYPLGRHILSAAGETDGGDLVTARSLDLEFVSPDVGGKFVLRLMVPLLGLLAVVMIVAAVGPMLFGRGTFHPGHYGVAGGAVCPRCTLPFSRHALSPNLVWGKLERCPHCGRVGIVARATPEALAAAEERLAGKAGPQPPGSIQEELHRQIDDSRFEDRR